MSDNADVGRPDFHQSRHFVPLLTFSVPFSASKDKSTKVKSKDDGHAARARDSTAHAHDVGAPHLAPKSGRALALTGPLGLAASRRKEKPPEDRVCVLVPAPAATRSRGERFETYNIHAKKKTHNKPVLLREKNRQGRRERKNGAGFAETMDERCDRVETKPVSWAVEQSRRQR